MPCASFDLLENTVVLFYAEITAVTSRTTRNGEYKRSWHEHSIWVPAALCGPPFDLGLLQKDPVPWPEEVFV